jgi:hypothetical protein
MTSTVVEAPSLTIPVDPEHGALRLSVTAMFLFFLVAGYIAANMIIRVEGINIIAVLLALVGAWLLTNLIENQLKRRWPSGRSVQVDEQGVRIVSKGRVEADINGQLQVNPLGWRFPIKKRTRVPKGWFVVAMALEQEGNYVAVYSFMSPEAFQKMPLASHFTLLPSPNELKKSQSGERDLRLAGQYRRLFSAEQIRWMSGAEMTNSDFEMYMARLQVLYPKWMLKD